MRERRGPDVLTPIRKWMEQARIREESSVDLLSRFRSAHDEAAFGVLLGRHGPKVLAICRRELDESAAEDAFQETFLALVRRGVYIREEDKFEAWLNQTARRIAQRRAIHERNRSRVERAASCLGEESLDPTPAIESEESVQVVRDRLNQLTEEYRIPIELRYLRGLTPGEIAKELGLPEKTVKTRLYRGLRRLREQCRPAGVTLGSLTSLGGLKVHGLPRVSESLAQAVLMRALAEGATTGIRATRWVMLMGTVTLVGLIGTGVALVPRHEQRVSEGRITQPGSETESLEAKNLRLLHHEVLPRLTPAVGRMMLNAEVELQRAEAVGSEVICEFRTTGGFGGTSRVELTYCVAARRVRCRVDLGDRGTWRTVDLEKPLILAQWGNWDDRRRLTVTFPGIDEVEDAFTLLPWDERAADWIEQGFHVSDDAGLMIPWEVAHLTSGDDRALYAVTREGWLLRHSRQEVGKNWTCLGGCPPRWFAVANGKVFITREGGDGKPELAWRAITRPGDRWQSAGPCIAEPILGGGGRLFTWNGEQIWSRPAIVESAEWEPIATLPGSGGLITDGTRLVFRAEGTGQLLIRPLDGGEWTVWDQGRLACRMAFVGQRVLLFNAYDERASEVVARPLDGTQSEWIVVGKVMPPTKPSKD